MSGFFWVCLGAAFGAPARYLVDRFVQSRLDAVMPWGTLCVNVIGSFVLGFVTGLATQHQVSGTVMTVIGPGFCGALTTYSTLSYETLRLYEDGARLYAGTNLGLSLVTGLGAAVAGFGIGTLF
ncbi:MAG TPA: fluoride efflux transporter CrcB [Nocardioides sp.]|nr:fluoride efflux transporter CrcB [Nocardioides sp.]